MRVVLRRLEENGRGCPFAPLQAQTGLARPKIRKARMSTKVAMTHKRAWPHYSAMSKSKSSVQIVSTYSRLARWNGQPTYWKASRLLELEVALYVRPMRVQHGACSGQRDHVWLQAKHERHGRGQQRADELTGSVQWTSIR